MPSALPPVATCRPASVVTTPRGVICRIVLLPVSVTNRFPPASTAMPALPKALNENCATAPAPSVLPVVPVPASVVTAAAGVIFLIFWFWLSTTYRLPALSMAMPPGRLNRASVARPVKASQGARRAASEGSDHPRRCDLPDRVIEVVGDVQVTDRVHHDAVWTAESRCAAGGIDVAEEATRQRGDHSCRGDRPNPVVLGIRHVQVTGDIHGHALREKEARRRTCTV